MNQNLMKILKSILTAERETWQEIIWHPQGNFFLQVVSFFPSYKTWGQNITTFALFGPHRGALVSLWPFFWKYVLAEFSKSIFRIFRYDYWAPWEYLNIAFLPCSIKIVSCHAIICPMMEIVRAQQFSSTIILYFLDPFCYLTLLLGALL